jgi:flagellar biosynthetic protein FlhB
MANRSDRTEKPTPKRRREARKKGQIARSREASFAAVFITLFVFFAVGMGFLFEEFGSLFRIFLQDFQTEDFTLPAVQNMAKAFFTSVSILAGPPIFLTLLVGIGATFLQGGAVFTAEPMKFKPDKVNPAKNLKKICSKRGLVELVKSVALVSVVVYLSVSILTDYIDVFQSMVIMDLGSILAIWGEILFRIGLWVGVFLVIVAAGDYLFQRYSHEEGLKQTKQEVKEDLKDTEGQPLVKSRIRRMQRDMARRRMIAAVKEADVVVTNPSHFAVALKYEMFAMNAPLLVAKGQDFLAQKIREAADQNEVPIVEDPPLARTLYRTVEVGDQVPADLYRAVAKILAYVYKLKEEKYH